MRTLSTLALILFSAGVQAATVNTTLTVDATGSLSLTTGTFTATGTASLSGIGSGTITGSVPTTGISGTSATAQFIITLSGGNTITGELTVPLALVLGTSPDGTGTAKITGGTGAYAGASGLFPTLTGTGSGSIAKVTLNFKGDGTITTGSGPGAPTPTITDVLDAGGYTKNIASGSVFVVKGSNLSASGTNLAAFPLPTAINGVKITFTPTAGGAGTDAFMVYTYNQDRNQLAAILPSKVTSGNYNVTVTNNGVTSAPFGAAVVERKIGLVTQDASGSGLALVQNYISTTQLDVNRFTTGSTFGTTISPAKPGQVLIAWATGMGAVTGAENVASPGFDFSANGVDVRILVGGVVIKPVYGGRAPGLAGTDQINFTLPSDIPTGCTVPFQISVNGVLSNSTFIAIAPSSGASACVAPGFTTDQLRRFDQGGTYTLGYFGLSQITQTVPTLGTIKVNGASGTFIQYSGFQLAAGSSQGADFSTAPGSCSVLHTTTSQGSGGGSVNYKTLDAGVVTLNGPPASGISNRAFKENVFDGIISYSLTLASEGLPAIPGVTAETGTIVGGDYTISGAGGKDVGVFNAKINVGTPLTIPGGLPTSVTRSAGLTLNWTGGNPTDLVQISGGSSSRTGSGSSAVTESWTFNCYANAGQGSFTVPASILNQLPPIAVSANGSGGTLQVVTTAAPTSVINSFTAPLTAGGSIDTGLFFALIGIAGTVSYQ